MANYIYKTNTVTTKKMAGFYDAEKHTIDTDDTSRDIVEELKVFEGAPIEIVVKVKEVENLANKE